MKLWHFAGIGFVLGACFTSDIALAGNCKEAGYLVGAAQDDITGPVAEVGMMGYADVKQKTAGLHTRLRSRSMVISDRCRQTTVAMTIADLGQIFGGVKDAVVAQLGKELPGVFTHKNVLLSATHTHAGPGGFAHFALYNITTLGYSPDNFQTIVKGITQSIARAYRQQQAADLSVSRGELDGTQWNRSPEAYALNPADERARYGRDTDSEMTLLKVTATNGKALASFNWYPVHGVSMPMENRLIDGDNKGLASYFFEKKMGTDYLKDQEFIAGFVQSNSGDISPYDVTIPEEKKSDGFARTELSARKQFEKALELFEGPQDSLSGPIRFVHRFIDLPGRLVSDSYTNAGPQLTCNAVLGVSFAAGTENGQPISLFKEGTIWGVNWPKITVMPNEQDCQKEKVMLLPVGYVKPDPWVARVAPFQILQLGQLAIVAAPFEITTMAGRRLRELIQDALAKDGVRYVVLSALANEYLHYVATREEYAAQNYEGGSTLYGPWSLAAYSQVYNELAQSMSEGRILHDEGQPLDLSQKQVTLDIGVVYDGTPIGKDFGSVRRQTKSAYARGGKAVAEFWGAHPSNGKNPNYLSVERWDAERWTTIRRDWDPDTIFRWKRDGLAHSIVTVEWRIGEDVPAGVYRLCARGHSKAFLSRDISPYEGCSASFQVN